MSRFRIQAGTSDPLRVVIDGADLDSQVFTDILFDGNQVPLRVMQIGTAQAPLLGLTEFVGYGGGNISSAIPIAHPVTGRRPLVNCLLNSLTTPSWIAVPRVDQVSFSGIVMSAAGGGVLATDTNLYAVNFSNISPFGGVSAPVVTFVAFYNNLG